MSAQEVTQPVEPRLHDDKLLGEHRLGRAGWIIIGLTSRPDDGLVLLLLAGMDASFKTPNVLLKQRLAQVVVLICEPLLLRLELAHVHRLAVLQALGLRVLTPLGNDLALERVQLAGQRDFFISYFFLQRAQLGQRLV